MTSAFWAPKSQPEPMIDPVEAHSRPIRPISRFSETGRRVGCCSIETDIGHLPYAALRRHTATPGSLVRPDRAPDCRGSIVRQNGPPVKGTHWVIP